MQNIFSYIKKYQNTNFESLEFNEIDAAVLSLLPYLDFQGITNHKTTETLSDCLSIFLTTYKKNNFKNQVLCHENFIKLAKTLRKSERYKSLLVTNYIVSVTDNKEFGAMTIILPDKTKVIAYKGTTTELVGWKEDFTFSYKFLSPAEKDAIKYIHKNTSIFDKNIIVLGHSKGGHLSLVAAMNSYPFITHKITKIYNFDGPGILKKFSNELLYKRIAKKIVHIVPDNSFFGLLLKHSDNYRVVKTTEKGLASHSIFTWQTKEYQFVKTNLSALSQNLDKSIFLWLKKYSYKDREYLINTIFNYLEINDISNISELKDIKRLITLYKNRHQIDKKTLDIITDFIKFNYNYHKTKTEIELI